MAPLTYNERAERGHARPPVATATNYLDLLQLQAYWGPDRLNHHTAPTSMVYALREALRSWTRRGWRLAGRGIGRPNDALRAPGFARWASTCSATSATKPR